MPGISRRYLLVLGLQPRAGARNLVIGETPTRDLVDPQLLLLEHSPEPESLAVYRNGLRQNPGGDYQPAGATVRMLVSPYNGDDIVLCDYWW